MRSPAYAKLRPKKATPATDFGTAAHCALLEPDSLRTRYGVDPECPKRGGFPAGWRSTNDYKARRAEVMSATGRVGLLTAEEIEGLDQIVDRLRTNKVGRVIGSVPGQREISVFVPDPMRGLIRKIRPDLWLPAARMIVDVKTARDHRPGPFARSALTYGYHRASAFYLDTMSIETDVEHFVFLVINSEPPWELACYTLDIDSIEQGRMEYKRLLDEWKRCEDTGRWPGGSDEITELRIPDYAIDYYKTEGESPWQ